MSFWIFMFVTVLLIPLSMVFCGWYYKNYIPKEKLNLHGYLRKSKVKNHKEKYYLSGYRTRRSMQNDETFVFAQKRFGKIWLRTGLILFIPSILPMLYIMGERDKDFIGIVGGVVVFLQVILMLLPLYFVEKALKENFDHDGNRIDKRDS